MAEMGKPKNGLRAGKSGPGRIGAGTGKSKAGDAAARARHGTQGGSDATPRERSARVPQGRAGGKGGGARRG